MPRTHHRRSPAPPLNCFVCTRRGDSAWSALAEEEVSLLDTARTTRRHRPGEILFRQGDPCSGVYCVEAGTVAMRRTDCAGNSLLVRLVHAGEALGYRDFFGGEAHTTTAEVLEVATICMIGLVALRELLARNPNLGLNFLHRISRDLDAAEDALLQNASLSVRTRLAHLLLTLAERYARGRDGHTVTFSLPMTRQDLAALLGTRPETITRTMQALEQDKLLRCAGRRVTLRNRHALLDEIGAE